MNLYFELARKKISGAVLIILKKQLQTASLATARCFPMTREEKQLEDIAQSCGSWGSKKKKRLRSAGVFKKIFTKCFWSHINTVKYKNCFDGPD